MGLLSVFDKAKANKDDQRAFQRADEIARGFYDLYRWFRYEPFRKIYIQWFLQDVLDKEAEHDNDTFINEYMADFFKVSRNLGYSITSNDRSSMVAFLLLTYLSNSGEPTYPFFVKCCKDPKVSQSHLDFYKSVEAQADKNIDVLQFYSLVRRFHDESRIEYLDLILRYAQYLIDEAGLSGNKVELFINRIKYTQSQAPDVWYTGSPITSPATHSSYVPDLDDYDDDEDEDDYDDEDDDWDDDDFDDDWDDDDFDDDEYDDDEEDEDIDEFDDPVDHAVHINHDHSYKSDWLHSNPMTDHYYGNHGEFDRNDESRRISEDIQQFHNSNPDAKLTDHYFWDDVLDAETDGYLD